MNDVLTDPGSAQFRNLYLLNQATVCGGVNAQNSVGSYVVFRWFRANKLGMEMASHVRKRMTTGISFVSGWVWFFSQLIMLNSDTFSS